MRGTRHERRRLARAIPKSPQAIPEVAISRCTIAIVRRAGYRAFLVATRFQQREFEI